MNGDLNNVTQDLARAVDAAYKPEDQRNVEFSNKTTRYIPDDSDAETAVFIQKTAEGKDRLMINFRGTSGANDIATDVVLATTGVGTSDRGKKDRETVRKLLEKYPDAEVVVGGHSLGGASADSAVKNLIDESSGLSDRLYSVSFNKGSSPFNSTPADGPSAANRYSYVVGGDIISTTDANATQTIKGLCSGNSSHSMVQFTGGEGCNDDPSLLQKANKFGEGATAAVIGTLQSVGSAAVSLIPGVGARKDEAKANQAKLKNRMFGDDREPSLKDYERILASQAEEKAQEIRQELTEQNRLDQENRMMNQRDQQAAQPPQAAPSFEGMSTSPQGPPTRANAPPNIQTASTGSSGWTVRSPQQGSVDRRPPWVVRPGPAPIVTASTETARQADSVTRYPGDPSPPPVPQTSPTQQRRSSDPLSLSDLKSPTLPSLDTSAKWPTLPPSPPTSTSIPSTGPPVQVNFGTSSSSSSSTVDPNTLAQQYRASVSRMRHKNRYAKFSEENLDTLAKIDESLYQRGQLQGQSQRKMQELDNNIADVGEGIRNLDVRRSASQQKTTQLINEFQQRQANSVSLGSAGQGYEFRASQQTLSDRAQSISDEFARRQSSTDRRSLDGGIRRPREYESIGESGRGDRKRERLIPQQPKRAGSELYSYPETKRADLKSSLHAMDGVSEQDLLASSQRTSGRIPPITPGALTVNVPATSQGTSGSSQVSQTPPTSVAPAAGPSNPRTIASAIAQRVKERRELERKLKERAKRSRKKPDRFKPY